MDCGVQRHTYHVPCSLVLSVCLVCLVSFVSCVRFARLVEVFTNIGVGVQGGETFFAQGCSTNLEQTLIAQASVATAVQQGIPVPSKPSSAVDVDDYARASAVQKAAMLRASIRRDSARVLHRAPSRHRSAGINRIQHNHKKVER